MKLLIAVLILTTAALPPAVACAAAPAHRNGYIQLVRDGDVWWFQDAAGEKFFSLGVNCVGGCFGHCEERPPGEARKGRIVRQLRAMGFNTAGAWSSPSVWKDFYFADQIYTGFVESANDVFDESFWAEFERHLTKEIQPFAGNADFMGYFLDNERKWDPCAVLQFYLQLHRDAPGSRALMEFLQDLYEGKIKLLNRNWNASFRSFEDIAGSSAPKCGSVLLEKLFKPWRNRVAAHYYENYCRLLRRLDPHHLILGIRYKGIPELPLFQLLAPYFDVNSINHYNRYAQLDARYSEFYRISGKPLLITEFSFSGYPHPGHASQLFIDVYSQENRSIGYSKYVLSAARAPYMVGMHWFMWRDYAGNWDYPPDINVGLVSSDETEIYSQLEGRIKETNNAVNAAHRTAVTPEQAKRPLGLRLLHRFAAGIDGDLSEWDQRHLFLPQETARLLDGDDTEQRFYLSWDGNLLFVAGDIADSRMDYPGADSLWQADYLSLYLRPSVGRKNGTTDYALFYIHPTGGGAAGNEPRVIEWRVPEGYRPLPSKVSLRPKAGGYILEAAIPLKFASGKPLHPGMKYQMKLIHQDANGIRRASRTDLIAVEP